MQSWNQVQILSCTMIFIDYVDVGTAQRLLQWDQNTWNTVSGSKNRTIIKQYLDINQTMIGQFFLNYRLLFELNVDLKERKETKAS
jgi:hypothetical protein